MIDLLVDAVNNGSVPSSENLSYAIATIGVVFSSYLLRCFQVHISRKLELDKWIALALKEREAKKHDVLFKKGDSEDKEIFLTASEIRKGVVAKEVDPQQHIVNLSKRCRKYARDERRVNAITEEFYQEAYDTAGNLEQFEDLENAPALHGVPVSVKDCVDVKGACTTGGMACRLNKKDKDDCLIMELCRKAGAIPLCRGNVVQVMMVAEANNRIYGRTRNPWDLSRTPGGSTGGDAALVSTGCVPLSIAADGGGSIRIPSSYCGIVGYKPTSNRLSFLRCMRPRLNDTYGAGVALQSVLGPMARSVEDCAQFMKAVCVPELWEKDRNVAPVPFDDKEYNCTKRMKIGYFDTDGFFEPCASSKRAVRETIEALEKAGHTCVPFKMPTDGWLHLKIFIGTLCAEGKSRSFFEALEGEPLVSEYHPMILGSYVANYVHRFVSLVDKRAGHCFDAFRERSVYELWALCGELLNMRTKWSEAMIEGGIDALVFPSSPIPAPQTGTSGRIPSASYMFLAPLLLWPSGVLPITTVRPDEQHYRKKDIPKNQRDFSATFTAMAMEGSAGLPMGVSVMTTMYKDERCLRLMKEIESLVKFNATPTAYKSDTKEYFD